ncbi:MAG TPA: DUF2589 domain-containing protein [Thermoanaerobaculia bacterium]|nr:DUF2589 domain-containing protein [Thermoanaerobaculia bacterium]
MLDFSDLVGAIQASVQGATDTLARENYALFRQYFFDAKDAGDAKEILQEALRDVATLSESKRPKEVVKRLTESLEAASTALEGSTGVLQPKLVAIDYPMITSEGPTVHTVHVPLITLSPYSATQISKLTFKADLEVQSTDEGKLQVAFLPSGSSVQPPPAKKSSGAKRGAEDSTSLTANASIEIVIEGTPAADGLRKVIEGYERALRAQIPG